MTIGTLLAFTLYLGNFFDPVQQLSQLYNTFLSATAALDRITTVLARNRTSWTNARARTHRRARALRPRPLRVRRPSGRPPRLRSRRAAGTTVALVGHTGAGKSTIAKLLARFYDPRAGALTIDGTDVRDVTQESLRRQLGIVPQEGFLFAGSIGDNIAFGRPSATRVEIEAAAAAVGAAGFIEELPENFDTEVGERGFKLSLGQRQLIAFARALLADPRILILDEATSSVDIGTERKIDLGLRRLRRTHRVHHRPPPSTIRRADMIVVLDHGHIVDVGTHDELIARPAIHAPVRRLGRRGRVARPGTSF
jgi:ATP-binding cassette subfamily B protein